jgi:hypothetical protein
MGISVDFAPDLVSQSTKSLAVWVTQTDELLGHGLYCRNKSSNSRNRSIVIPVELRVEMLETQSGPCA